MITHLSINHARIHPPFLKFHHRRNKYIYTRICLRSHAFILLQVARVMSNKPKKRIVGGE